jgi:hypothetical protein
MGLKFRFVGIESAIGNVRVSAFGQLLDLTPEAAHDCVLGRVPVVPEADFTGITEDEINQFSTPDAHRDASPAFNAKKIALHKKAAAYRAAYETAAATGDTFMKRAGLQASTPAPATGRWPTTQADAAHEAE